MSFLEPHSEKGCVSKNNTLRDAMPAEPWILLRRMPCGIWVVNCLQIDTDFYCGKLFFVS